MADVTNGLRPDGLRPNLGAARGTRSSVTMPPRGVPPAGALRGAGDGNGSVATPPPDRGAPRPGVGAKAGLAVQLMGAAMSLALLAGGAIWGYKLIVRDATGVPVVRAMEGPMRQAPGDPGGSVALNTGLAVNAVAAVGEAAPPEDVLVLAPPTPDLTDEDLLVAPTAEADEFFPEDFEEQAEVAADLTADPANTAPVAAEAVAPLPAPSPDQPLSAADILALADAISAGATPLTALADAPVVAADLADTPVEPDPVIVGATPVEPDAGVAGVDAAAQAIAEAVAEAAAPENLEATPAESASAEAATVDAEGRLLRAPRPAQRPAGLGTATVEAPEATGQSFAVSTADVPLGTTLVQLGAFDSPDLAGAEWTRLAQRFAAFMEGKDPLVQEATSGGRAFFRLRATGFVDIADARRFCSTLVAEGAACIPVVIQ